MAQTREAEIPLPLTSTGPYYCRTTVLGVRVGVNAPASTGIATSRRLGVAWLLLRVDRQAFQGDSALLPRNFRQDHPKVEAVVDLDPERLCAVFSDNPDDRGRRIASGSVAFWVEDLEGHGGEADVPSMADGPLKVCHKKDVSVQNSCKEADRDVQLTGDRKRVDGPRLAILQATGELTSFPLPDVTVPVAVLGDKGARSGQDLDVFGPPRRNVSLPVVRLPVVQCFAMYPNRAFEDDQRVVRCRREPIQQKGACVVSARDGFGTHRRPFRRRTTEAVFRRATG